MEGDVSRRVQGTSQQKSGKGKGGKEWKRAGTLFLSGLLDDDGDEASCVPTFSHALMCDVRWDFPGPLE